jgi:hypothetical protein
MAPSPVEKGPPDVRPPTLRPPFAAPAIRGRKATGYQACRMYDEMARSWTANSSYIPSANSACSTLGITTRTADEAFLDGDAPPHPAPSRRPATLGQAGRQAPRLGHCKVAAPVALGATRAARAVQRHSFLRPILAPVAGAAIRGRW